jgi:hypothetical protein
MNGKLTLQDAIDILDYASEGRTVSAKPDLLANEMNRRIARIIDAERDVARGQALREAAELTTTLDPRHDDIHGLILALLSKSGAEALAEHDQSTREKYRADLIVEGWIGPVQAEQVAASLQRMTDLVRYARLFLHNEGLITDEEYTSILQDSEGRVARLEGYDAAIKQVAAEARRDELPSREVLASLLFEVDNEDGDALWPLDWERHPYCRWALRNADKILARLAALPASGQAEAKETK